MTYEYIKQRYGLTFSIGDKVHHTETHKDGVVLAPKMSHSHYVHVQFDEGYSGLCHPQELNIIAFDRAERNSI